MAFSLVSTVFNEKKRLQQTIADLEAQSLLPSEIVITDAGSTDGTWEMLHNWKAKSAIHIVLLQEKGCNVSRGRNLAIRAAQHELIASTDFGCRFHPDWLQSILNPFSNPEVDVVGGAFSIVSTDLPTVAAKADYILQNAYPVVMDEYFSVSSRSIAYKKNVWETIGGYEEWLTLAADDTIFWRLIKRHKFNYIFVNKPYVSWLRHQTYSAFAKEAARYGLGDGESGINFRNTVSHLIETVFRCLFLGFVIFSPIFFYLGIGWVLLLLLPLSFGLRSYKAAFRNWRNVPKRFPLSVFLSSLYPIEYSRWMYLQAYIKGYWLSPNALKQQRMALQKRLST